MAAARNKRAGPTRVAPRSFSSVSLSTRRSFNYGRGEICGGGGGGGLAAASRASNHSGVSLPGKRIRIVELTVVSGSSSRRIACPALSPVPMVTMRFTLLPTTLSRPTRLPHLGNCSTLLLGRSRLCLGTTLFRKLSGQAVHLPAFYTSTGQTTIYQEV